MTKRNPTSKRFPRASVDDPTRSPHALYGPYKARGLRSSRWLRVVGWLLVLFYLSWAGATIILAFARWQ